MAQFTNQATLTYNNSVVNSNIAVGEIRESLTADKNAALDTYTVGDSVTYIISAVNEGPTALSGLSITDNLGEYTFGTQSLYPLTYVDGSVQLYINGVLQAPPTVVAGPPLVFSGINLPANSNLVLVYGATVNEFAPLMQDATITNTAVIGGIATPVTVSETITAQSQPDLTITKTIDPVPVSANGTLTYTFVIRNFGNTAVTEEANAVVTDTFDPILSNLTVTFNGEVWEEGTNYTYDESAGLFTTIAGQITVPAATYQQDVTTGEWIVTPGVSTLVITGTL